jgi:hypothetical protein
MVKANLFIDLFANLRVPTRTLMYKSFKNVRIKGIYQESE